MLNLIMIFKIQVAVMVQKQISQKINLQSYGFEWFNQKREQWFRKWKKNQLQLIKMKMLLFDNEFLERRIHWIMGIRSRFQRIKNE
ncbi:unnamed protein product [Paramecium sonneborni]|uniref:Uncharacterized protein n=1 Tax=Paramecium sonneborni TaxID=65129 RepID=A0A8S1JW77_9CILI|nr:unnamed protein product [Paramecium sonneborni]